jgi:hypothetical protein
MISYQEVSLAMLRHEFLNATYFPSPSLPSPHILWQACPLQIAQLYDSCHFQHHRHQHHYGSDDEQPMYSG